MWTDDHCHLPADVGEAAAVVEDARGAGVTRMITIGTTLEDSRAAIALANTLDGVSATVGIHPHEAKDGLAGVEALLTEPKVVAVGECGLDYHYDHSPRETQREVFAQQIALAHRHDLALVIHTRNAWDDTFALLDENGVPPRTVFHCFSGGDREARRALDLGAYQSFSGIVTVPTADDVRAAAVLCPSDRLLVATASPYLTPVPHRGTPNRPAFVTLVGEAIGNLKGASAEQMATLTWANADRAY